ncbi:unnamed protein product [Effrenium voratum]|nr:unnamed protein product [Effrenium voratum]
MSVSPSIANTLSRSFNFFEAEKRNSRRPRLLSAGQVRSPRTVSWPDAGSPRGADEVTMMLCPRPSKPVPAELHSVTMMLCPRPSKPVLPEFHSVTWPDAGSPRGADEVTMMLCPRPSKLVLPEFHSVTWPDAGSPRGAGEVTMMLCPRPFKPVLPEFHSVTWPDAGSPRGADEVTMMLCRLGKLPKALASHPFRHPCFQEVATNRANGAVLGTCLALLAGS